MHGSKLSNFTTDIFLFLDLQVLMNFSSLKIIRTRKRNVFIFFFNNFKFFFSFCAQN
jgi:hypothetical protein